MSTEEFAPRAMTSGSAMAYLGIRRRVWNSLKQQLTPIRLGTSVLYDRIDLDDLFNRLKENHSTLGRKVPIGNSSVPASPPDVVTSSMDGRPSQPRKGDRQWAVSKASTLTQEVGNGGSTRSSEANAFKVVMARIRTRSSP
jgi:hypothetical protein